MDSRAFWFSVTCCLTCILCEDAFGGLTFGNISAGINDATRLDAGMSGREDIQRSIEMQTRGDGISLRDDQPKSDASQKPQLVRSLLMKREMLNISRKTECSRYCIRQLGSDKDTFQDINLFWSFAENQNETGKLLRPDNLNNIIYQSDANGFLPHITNVIDVPYHVRTLTFSLISDPNLKISRRTSINNKTSATLEDKCQIYLNLGCDINVEGNSDDQRNEFPSKSHTDYRNVETFWKPFQDGTFLKKLAQRTNLSGYTETKFHVDANVTGITLNIWGNLTRAILAIPTNRSMQKPGITMSLARTYDAKGVAIGVRNTPPGGWRVKLTGVENSKYSFNVVAYLDANKGNTTGNGIIDSRYTSESNEESDFDQTLDKRHATRNNETIMMIRKIKKFNELAQGTHQNAGDDLTDSMLLMNAKINEKPKFVFERSVEIMEPTNRDDRTAIENSADVLLFSSGSTVNVINRTITHNNSMIHYDNFQNLQKVSNNEMNRKIPVLQQQKIQGRSSEVASLNEEDINMNVKSFTNKNVSAEITNSGKNQELSVQSDINYNEDLFERKKLILVELNANSNLIARSGTIHRVVFDVSNNCVLPVKYDIRARSSPFGIYNLQPLYTWLYPGQTNQIAVDILIPRGTSQGTVNTLTLFIDGTKITEKTVHIYVQDTFSKMTDDEKPTIDYSFNSNCAGKLDRDRCAKTLWTADITVRDSDSGLKQVISSPNGIYPRTEFISGTREPVTFFYSSTCCSRTARITAIDLMNNQHSRTIDVTAWDNLSQGEIAAITVGALFLLLLLILVIILIVYCVRRKSGHDLPYTQRYGSRPPARSERTSF